MRGFDDLVWFIAWCLCWLMYISLFVLLYLITVVCSLIVVVGWWFGLISLAFNGVW